MKVSLQLRAAATRTSRMLNLDIAIAAVILGLATVVTGVALIFVPAAVILAGLLLLLLGIGRLRA